MRLTLCRNCRFSASGRPCRHHHPWSFDCGCPGHRRGHDESRCHRDGRRRAHDQSPTGEEAGRHDRGRCAAGDDRRYDGGHRIARLCRDGGHDHPRRDQASNPACRHDRPCRRGDHESSHGSQDADRKRSGFRRGNRSSLRMPCSSRKVRLQTHTTGAINRQRSR